MSPNSSALMGSAPKGQQGIASGFLALSRTIGLSVCVALTGGIFVALGGATAGLTLSTAQVNGPQLIALQQTFTNSYQAAFIACAVISMIAVGTALVRGKEEPQRASSPGKPSSQQLQSQR
jgi:hypothetical protein